MPIIPFNAKLFNLRSDLKSYFKISDEIIF